MPSEQPIPEPSQTDSELLRVRLERPLLEALDRLDRHATRAAAVASGGPSASCWPTDLAS